VWARPRCRLRSAASRLRCIDNVLSGAAESWTWRACRRHGRPCRGVPGERGGRSRWLWGSLPIAARAPGLTCGLATVKLLKRLALPFRDAWGRRLSESPRFVAPRRRKRHGYRERCADALASPGLVGASPSSPRSSAPTAEFFPRYLGRCPHFCRSRRDVTRAHRGRSSPHVGSSVGGWPTSCGRSSRSPRSCRRVRSPDSPHGPRGLWLFAFNGQVLGALSLAPRVRHAPSCSPRVRAGGEHARVWRER